jgi:hypothetical protein
MKQLLSKLLLSSALFWGLSVAEAKELVETKVVDLEADYCHMKLRRWTK